MGHSADLDLKDDDIENARDYLYIATCIRR